MITKDQNIALKTVANAASVNPDWADYVNYCLDREKGLRKQAFKSLNAFLIATKAWTLDQKIGFVKMLFPLFETVQDADYGAFPQPLGEKLLKPTLDEWCGLEVSDSQPFRWYGKYYRSVEHLFKALEIDSEDNIARETLIGWWAYDIYYSVHHLPDAYIGDNPQEDLLLIVKIKEHILLLTDSKLRERWTRELEEDAELVNNYIDWQDSGHPDLVKWGHENGKKVGYNISRTYYYDK